MKAEAIGFNTQHKTFEVTLRTDAGDFYQTDGEYTYNGTEVEVSELNVYELDGAATNLRLQVLKEMRYAIAEALDELAGEHIHAAWLEQDDDDFNAWNEGGKEDYYLNR